MPRHHVQHARNVGPILFALNENIAHVMPCVTACAVMSWAHCMAHAHSKPAALIIHGVPGFTYGCAICTGRTIFIKINCLTFWHPKYENRKPEHAEKDSHCHAQ